MSWGREPEPPADCQDCIKALNWCAEYKALNHPDRPYNRGACFMYEGGRKGFKNPVQCSHCGTVFESGAIRFHKHGCCECYGHTPLSCKHIKDPLSI